MKCIFDIDCAKRYTNPNLKVELKDGINGISMYATTPIKKGNIIAYYKFKVFKDENHRAKKKGRYSVAVQTKSGNFSRTLIGDISSSSLAMPKYDIPFWGYYANKPDNNNDKNAVLNFNNSQVYNNKNILKVGDYVVYKIIASRDIMPGEEILWCYNNVYNKIHGVKC